MQQGGFGETGMRVIGNKLGTTFAGIATALLIAGTASTAQAGGATGHFVLACENGANYRLTAGAVSVFGEVVAGQLHLSRHHAVHVRLIPMGDGYRYAAPGIWLDGFRDQAQLHFGKREPVNCSVGQV
jgi:hypothetical protein